MRFPLVRIANERRLRARGTAPSTLRTAGVGSLLLLSLALPGCGAEQTDSTVIVDQSLPATSSTFYYDEGCQLLYTPSTLKPVWPLLYMAETAWGRASTTRSMFTTATCAAGNIREACRMHPFSIPDIEGRGLGFTSLEETFTVRGDTRSELDTDPQCEVLAARWYFATVTCNIAMTMWEPHGVESNAPPPSTWVDQCIEDVVRVSESHDAIPVSESLPPSPLRTLSEALWGERRDTAVDVFLGVFRAAVSVRNICSAESVGAEDIGIVPFGEVDAGITETYSVSAYPIDEPDAACEQQTAPTQLVQLLCGELESCITEVNAVVNAATKRLR